MKLTHFLNKHIKLLMKTFSIFKNQYLFQLDTYANCILASSETLQSKIENSGWTALVSPLCKREKNTENMVKVTDKVLFITIHYIKEKFLITCICFNKIYSCL